MRREGGGDEKKKRKVFRLTLHASLLTVISRGSVCTSSRNRRDKARCARLWVDGASSVFARRPRRRRHRLLPAVHPYRARGGRNAYPGAGDSGFPALRHPAAHAPEREPED